MTSKDIVITTHFNMGRADGMALREKATKGEITDTEIIDNEQAVPVYDSKKDYTKTPIDSPFRHGDQVYALIQPHNASYYTNIEPGTDGGATFWRIKHTTNPKKAKPWVKPTSTSPYKKGECMIWTNGSVMRATRDTVYSPEEYAPDWEVSING